jgi:hypothetical protein
MKKITMFLGVIMLAITSVNAQSFSRTYNPDLPIAYLTLLGLPPINASKFFVAANFKDVSNENGSMKAVCESTSNSNGTFTGNLLCTVNNTKVMRVNIALRSDTTGDFNYITSLTTTNLMSGEKTELKYTGTQHSAGEMVGFFYELLELFYDTDKLFTK